MYEIVELVDEDQNVHGSLPFRGRGVDSFSTARIPRTAELPYMVTDAGRAANFRALTCKTAPTRSRLAAPVERR
ncbi:hypothetical protein [Patulibacter medicamentivorans]|uniref:hypothetical protein n=1 Tax=Patulibacter medicamentivorans TaxID=1097667 RepID=UPI001478F031|nr:hypothetical protein [Patulibacter medicamentivorans]